MSFIPRTSFHFPSRAPSWYAGHMHKGLREMTAILPSIDVVLEARDARLPLSSVNAAFERMLSEGWSKPGREGVGRERVVVYTKRDLAEERFEQSLRNAFKKHANTHVLFNEARSDADTRKILRHLVAFGKTHALSEVRVLIAGMPNVGKSSLINALRRVGVKKGKAARTGSDPGITRKVAGTVKVHESDPAVYILDTPGIMVPFLGHGDEGAEMALKLALTSGIKPDLLDSETIADYLLYRLNLRDPTLFAPYPSCLPLGSSHAPTNSSTDLLCALATRIGALAKGGIPDLEASAKFLFTSFREGKFGRWTLDDLAPPPADATPVSLSVSQVVDARVQAFLEEQRAKRDAAPDSGEAAALRSRNAAKNYKKEEQRARRLARWKASTGEASAAAAAVRSGTDAAPSGGAKEGGA